MLTFAFMLSSLPCLHTFWHAIPTSFTLLFLYEYAVDEFGAVKCLQLTCQESVLVWSFSF